MQGALRGKGAIDDAQIADEGRRNVPVAVNVCCVHVQEEGLQLDAIFLEFVLQPPAKADTLKHGNISTCHL